MEVYIVGEDEATRTIILRVLKYCNGITVLKELPARGGQIKNDIPKYNQLSLSNPVILLMDLDNYSCAPELLKSFKITKNSDFIFNIAIDEAEAWLMADRENFAKYFQVNIDNIPKSSKTKMNGAHEVMEMCFPIKSSMYLTTKIIPSSRNQTFIAQMVPSNKAKKGKEYNTPVLPFIEKHWNIDNARRQSDSLNRMILRIEELKARYN